MQNIKSAVWKHGDKIDRVCFALWMSAWTTAWVTAMVVFIEISLAALGIGEFNTDGIWKFALGVFLGAHCFAGYARNKG